MPRQSRKFFVHARLVADDELIVAADDRDVAHKIAQERRKEDYRTVWIVEDEAVPELVFPVRAKTIPVR